MDRFFAFVSSQEEQGKKAKTAKEARDEIIRLLNTTGNLKGILKLLETQFKLYYENNTSFRSDFCDLYECYPDAPKGILYTLAYDPKKYKKGLLCEMAKTDQVEKLSQTLASYKGNEKKLLSEEIESNGWKDEDKIGDILWYYLKNKSSLTSRLFQLYYSSDYCNGNVKELYKRVKLYADHYKEIQDGEKVPYKTDEGVKKQGKLDKSLLKEGTMFNTLVLAQLKINQPKRKKPKRKKRGNNHSINS